MTPITQAHPYSAAIDAYERGPRTLRNAASGLTAKQLNTRLAPGTWSIQEVIVHMVDSDQAASHRMRRIAAEDMPLLVSYDENAFIARLDNASMDANEALELFDANRRFTARWLRTLEPAAFARVGIHTQRGKVTLGDILEIYVKHLDNHIVFTDGKRTALGM
ncbi:MAG: DinB family protein [Planctomycetota bacterium]